MNASTTDEFVNLILLSRSDSSSTLLCQIKIFSTTVPEVSFQEEHWYFRRQSILQNIEPYQLLTALQMAKHNVCLLWYFAVLARICEWRKTMIKEFDDGNGPFLGFGYG
jgi:hypothetical protein